MFDTLPFANEYGEDCTAWFVQHGYGLDWTVRRREALNKIVGIHNQRPRQFRDSYMTNTAPRDIHHQPGGFSNLAPAPASQICRMPGDEKTAQDQCLHGLRPV